LIQEWIEGDDTAVYFCLAYLDRASNPVVFMTGRKI